MKNLTRRWALALIAASMFGTAGATVAAAADADAAVRTQSAYVDPVDATDPPIED